MIGRQLSVSIAGETVTATVTPRAAVAFERQHKVGLIPAIVEQRKLEHLYSLMWESLRSAGPVPPFEKWLDTVDGLVEIVEEPAPLGESS